MASFEFGTTDRYTKYIVETSGSISGTWPNLVPRFNASYRLRCPGYMYWYSNGTTLGLHNASTRINLVVEMPNGGTTGVLGSCSVNLWWVGNGPSVKHTPGTSINAPGCFSGSGGVNHTFTVDPATTYESTSPTAITHNSVTFNYSLKPNAHRYYYCKFKDMISGKIFEPSSTLTYANNSTYTLTGLQPNTNYEIAVVVYDRNGNIVNTADANYRTKFRTKSALATPSLSITNVTSNSAQLSWNKIDGATAYDLEQNGVIKEYINNNLNLQLNPETRYSFRVRAKRGADYSVWSEASTITTPRAPLSTPTRLAVGNIEKRRAFLSWDPVSGASGYKIYLNEVYYGESKTPNVSLSLVPGTTYKASVLAYRGSEQSPSANITFTTLPEPTIIYVKNGGVWKQGELGIKQGSSWNDNVKLLIKKNGKWEDVVSYT